jgi:PAS domain S-box-containing protein
MPERLTSRLVRRRSPRRKTPRPRAHDAHPAVRRNAAFAALGQQLGGTSKALDAARVIAAITDEYIGWDAFSFTLHDPDTGLNQDVLDYDIVDGQREELQPILVGYPPGPLSAKMIREGAQLVLRDTPAFDPADSVPFGDYNRPSASLMFVPIRSNGRVLGFVSVQSYTYHAYTPDDLTFLQALADVCTGVLHRIRAETLIRLSEDRYRHMVDVSPHPTAVLSGQTFLYANAAALHLIGADTFHQLIGRPALDIVRHGEHPLTPEQGRGVLQELVDAGLVETQLRRLDGFLIDVELSLIPVTFDEKPAVMAVARDVTEQKRAARRSAAFAMLGQELSVARTPQAAAHVIAAAADDLVGWDAFSLSLYDRDDERMYPVLDQDIVDGQRMVVPFAEHSYKIGPISRRVMTEGALLLFREEVERSRIGIVNFGDAHRPSETLIFVPITSADTFIGLLSIQSYTPHAYTDADLRTVQALADHCAGALERIRAEDASRASERRSAAFATLGQKLSVARTPQAAAHVIAAAADDLVGWDAFSLSLYDRDDDRMYAILNQDIVDGNRTVVPPSECGFNVGPVARRVMSKGAQLMFREEVARSDIKLESFGDTSRPSASLIFVPINSGDMFIGMMSIQSYTPHAFDDADLRTVQALADHCAGALERLRAEGALRASEQRFRVLFEHAADAIFLIDPHHPDGTWPVVDCNDAACRINGYSREEIIGRSVDMLRVRATGGEEDTEFLQELHDNAMVSFESMNRRRDGTEYPIESAASLVRLGDQELVLEIDRDISERKRVEAALVTAHEAALEASRLKSEFLATMSHEIRTPMNGVIGMTELLLGTTLNTEQQELATVVRDSAQSLLGILNDILDFSKIEAGKLEINSCDFMPRTVLDNVVDLMAPRADERGIALTSVVEPTVPPVVHADCNRLRQILLNLVSNAVKFTEHGSVTIHTSVTTNEAATPCLHVEVRDTGIGISETAQRRLFGSFVQADGSTTRKYGGTGLGLAISKRLVELMGGSIAMRSTMGVGSVFSITLPYATPVAKVMMTSEAIVVASKDQQRGRLILVAEDNPVNQKVALMQLQKLGYQAHAVANGLEAVAVVARRHDDAQPAYDLILMDCHMPELDGFAATHAIRSFERQSWRGDDEPCRVPIVAMTANAMRGDREACIAAGMDDYLSKPVRISDLHNILNRWLPSADAAAE